MTETELKEIEIRVAKARVSFLAACDVALKDTPVLITEIQRLRKALDPEPIGEFIDRRKLRRSYDRDDSDEWSDGFRQGFLAAKEAAKDYSRQAPCNANVAAKGV
jgi:hypothetical protein